MSCFIIYIFACRYLLYHDGLSDSILRFIAYIFGYWTDGVARTIAASFCHKLIRLATMMHSNKLISFIKDDIIPNVIRCLSLEPGSDRDSESDPMRRDTDIGSDNSVGSESDILTDLCHDACQCTQDQVFVSMTYIYILLFQVLQLLNIYVDIMIYECSPFF